MDKTKRLFALLLCVAMILCLAGCTESPEAGADKQDASVNTPAPDSGAPVTSDDASKGDSTPSGDPVKVGFLFGFTGSQASQGEYIKRAMEMAEKEINEAGGVLGRPFEIQMEDDQAQTDKSVVVAKKFAEDPSIVAMSGFHMSAAILAASDTIAQYGVPTLYAGTTTSTYGLGNDYIFRLRPADGLATGALVDYAVNELKASKFAVLYNTADYGVNGKNLLVEYLAEAGITPLVEEGHNSGETDFTVTLMKIEDAGCDAIIVWGYNNELAVMTRQYKELGMESTCTFLGCSTLGASSYRTLVDPSISNGTITVTDFMFSNPDNAAFTERFESTYDMTPDYTAAVYYNSIMMLVDAIERAGSTDRDAVRDAIESINLKTECMGTVYCDENHDLIHSIIICKNNADGGLDFLEQIAQ